MKPFFSILLFFSIMALQAQELPYYEIADAPKEYTAGSVASRMVDGLGFRYYWATQGLVEENLLYRPNKESRSIYETLDHILVLSIMTLNALEQKEIDFSKKDSLTFLEMRKLTLNNFKKSSDILKESKDLSKFKMKIKRANGKVDEFPFWNQFNGPIADALWHVGQVVSFRRSSGNPLPKGVNFLTGKVKK